MECPTTPEGKPSGLGSFRFARHYSGNRVCFLFLQVLRCFSSLGVPYIPYVFRYIDVISEDFRMGQPTFRNGDVYIPEYIRYIYLIYLMYSGIYTSPLRNVGCPIRKSSDITSTYDSPRHIGVSPVLH